MLNENGSETMYWCDACKVWIASSCLDDHRCEAPVDLSDTAKLILLYGDSEQC